MPDVPPVTRAVRGSSGTLVRRHRPVLVDRESSSWRPTADALLGQAEHLEADVLAGHHRADLEGRRIGPVGALVDPAGQLVRRLEARSEGRRRRRRGPSRSVVPARTRPACPASRSVARAARSPPRAGCAGSSAGSTPMSSAYESATYGASWPRSPASQVRSESDAQNAPNASGVPGAGSHGVVMQTMTRDGSPVRSWSTPSTTISMRPSGGTRHDVGRHEVAAPREHAEVPPALHDLLEAGVGDRPSLEVREERARVDHDLRSGDDDVVVAGDRDHREQAEPVRSAGSPGSSSRAGDRQVPPGRRVTRTATAVRTAPAARTSALPPCTRRRTWPSPA